MNVITALTKDEYEKFKNGNEINSLSYFDFINKDLIDGVREFYNSYTGEETNAIPSLSRYLSSLIDLGTLETSMLSYIGCSTNSYLVGIKQNPNKTVYIGYNDLLIFNNKFSECKKNEIEALKIDLYDVLKIGKPKGNICVSFIDKLESSNDLVIRYLDENWICRYVPDKIKVSEKVGKLDMLDTFR